MNKKDLIKKAYGDSFIALEKHINENGFVNCVKNNSKISLIPYFEVSEIEFKGNEVRPKSLKGIENNNGWVKIYRENDLPQFDCNCWWLDKKDGLVLGKFILEGSKSFVMKNATHYKIIKDTELPLY
ncbi:hypothetical protein [Tenacibaculum piscium]|uniref:hypothetical protein n=1 Tax=Tenacibaculum piscium TaxID=1458515 RepID=UPI001F3EAA5D|nr:hypothetical protein [Tenacibaculum piscium]